MTAEAHHAAMHAPIRKHWPLSCKGHGDCHQGRANCRTPLTCSGLDADEAIASFRADYPPIATALLHRQPLPGAAAQTNDGTEDVPADLGDFLQQTNAITAVVRYGAIPTLITLCAALALTAAVFS